MHAVVACVILCRCSTHRTSQALATIDTLHAEQRPPSSSASNAPDRLLRSFSPPPHHAASFSLSNEKHLQQLQEQVVESVSPLLFPVWPLLLRSETTPQLVQRDAENEVLKRRLKHAAASNVRLNEMFKNVGNVLMPLLLPPPLLLLLHVTAAVYTLHDRRLINGCSRGS